MGGPQTPFTGTTGPGPSTDRQRDLDQALPRFWELPVEQVSLSHLCSVGGLSPPSCPHGRVPLGHCPEAGGFRALGRSAQPEQWLRPRINPEQGNDTGEGGWSLQDVS